MYRYFQISSLDTMGCIGCFGDAAWHVGMQYLLTILSNPVSARQHEDRMVFNIGKPLC